MRNFRIHDTNNISKYLKSNNKDTYEIINNYPINGKTYLPNCKKGFKISIINLSIEEININTTNNNIIFDPNSEDPFNTAINNISLEYGYTMNFIGVNKNNILGWFII